LLLRTLPISTYKNNPHNHTTTSNANPGAIKTPKTHTNTHKKTHKFFFTSNSFFPSLFTLSLSLSGLLYNLVIFVVVVAVDQRLLANAAADCACLLLLLLPPSLA
jgi:hypothetical protein